MPASPSVTVPPGSGTIIHAFGSEITIHLGGAETGGKFTMFTEVTPPGGGPPPHSHAEEDEWFYPLEGRVEFFQNGDWNEVSPGTAVFVPRGEVHTFRNPGEEPLRMLMHTMPAGIEKFFEACAAEFAKPDPPEMGRILAIGEKHRIHFVTG